MLFTSLPLPVFVSEVSSSFWQAVIIMPTNKKGNNFINFIVEDFNYYSSHGD